MFDGCRKNTNASGWSPQMMAALTEIDTSENGREWRLFTVATITDGPWKDLEGIGIGSNKKTLVRAVDSHTRAGH